MNEKCPKCKQFLMTHSDYCPVCAQIAESSKAAVKIKYTNADIEKVVGRIDELMTKATERITEFEGIINGFCKELGEDHPVLAMAELQKLKRNFNDLLTDYLCLAKDSGVDPLDSPHDKWLDVKQSQTRS